MQFSSSNSSFDDDDDVTLHRNAFFSASIAAKMDEDSDENMIDCEGIGDPVFVDKEMTKFYTAFKTDWLYVTIGDCVRINLANNGTGFGQVLAIFEDAEEEMFIEVRWFVGYNEVKHCKNL